MLDWEGLISQLLTASRWFCLSAEENGRLPTRSDRERSWKDPGIPEELLPRWSWVQSPLHRREHFTIVFFFNVLMCVCLYNSNIPNIVLRVRHRPQLVLADSREHFPHVLSDQGEPSVFQCVSVELVCPLVTVSRRDSVVVVFQDGLARMYLDNAKLPCIGEKM